MGVILPFPPRDEVDSKLLRMCDLRDMGQGGARVLLFTGVRYERRDEGDATIADECLSDGGDVASGCATPTCDRLNA